MLVRYADDYVAMCYSREQADEVKARLAAWLAPRGLRFNEDKTKVVHVEEGFSFLGFSIRRYVNRLGGKLLIKPSQESIKRFRERLSAEMKALRGANASAVIRRLNPIIRGWSAYYRSVVSSRTFSRAGPPHVAPHLPVGTPHAPEQVQGLGCHPVLRQVQPGQKRPVGVWRPGDRRLSHQVLLDQDRSSRTRPGMGLSR